jgi:nucleotide-binding universal stress UspA family protein
VHVIVADQRLGGETDGDLTTFRESAEAAMRKVAKEFDSRARGLSNTVLLGSTAQRVQHHAPRPVLVVRPTPRKPAAGRPSRP